MAKARAALGSPGFAAAEAAGRAIDYDHAMNQMREWLTSLASD